MLRHLSVCLEPYGVLWILLHQSVLTNLSVSVLLRRGWQLRWEPLRWAYNVFSKKSDDLYDVLDEQVKEMKHK